MAGFADFLFMVLVWIFCLLIFAISAFSIYTFCSSGFMRFSPPIPTLGAVKQGIIADVAARLRQASGLTIMDLGSGWGTLLLPLAAQFPQHQFIGIEKALLPYLISKFRARKYKNLCIVRQDIFKTDIGGADIVLLFLLQHVMVKAAKKFKSELKQGTILYSNRFTIPDVKLLEKKSYGSDYKSFYIYRI